MPDGDLATKRLSRRTFLLGGGAGFALLAGGVLTGLGVDKARAEQSIAAALAELG